MAKDDAVKDGNKTIDIQFTDATQNDSIRTVRCQNCFTTWWTIHHPNSFTECPYCKMKSNDTRRIIFYWDLENEHILLD